MGASPSKSCRIDLIWQTTKWLLNWETSLEEEEISWQLLVNPLTDGSEAATKDLTKRLMAAWKWVWVVSVSLSVHPHPLYSTSGSFSMRIQQDMAGASKGGSWPMPACFSTWGRPWMGELGDLTESILHLKSPC